MHYQQRPSTQVKDVLLPSDLRPGCPAVIDNRSAPVFELQGRFLLLVCKRVANVCFPQKVQKKIGKHSTKSGEVQVLHSLLAPIAED